MRGGDWTLDLREPYDARPMVAVPSVIATTAASDLELARHRCSGVVCAGTSACRCSITEAVRRGRGVLAEGGAARRRHREAHRSLAGRQVRRARAWIRSADLVGQGRTSRSSPRASSACARRSSAHLGGRDLYVVDAYAGADPAHRMARAGRDAERRSTRSSRGSCSSRPEAEELDGLHAGSARAARARARGRPDDDGTRTRHVHRAAPDDAPRS